MHSSDDNLNLEQVTEYRGLTMSLGKAASMLGGVIGSGLGGLTLIRIIQCWGGSDLITSAYHRDNLSQMSADRLDTLSRDIIDYLEGISDPDKVRLSKRWDKHKDYETYGLSAKDYTALYERFNPGFNAFTTGQHLRLADRWTQ